MRYSYFNIVCPKKQQWEQPDKQCPAVGVYQSEQQAIEAAKKQVVNRPKQIIAVCRMHRSDFVGMVARVEYSDVVRVKLNVEQTQLTF